MRHSPLIMAACLALPLFITMDAGAAEHLNIKTGLWEITSVMQTSGVPPLPKELLEKMTPAQRAKMRADAQSKPSRDVSRECVTQKDIAKPFSTADADNCKESIVTTTRTTQEVHIVCDREPKGSGTMRITTPNSESMTGSMELKLGSGADAFTVKGDLRGRWLGSDCGEEADDEDSDADGDEDEGTD